MHILISPHWCIIVPTIASIFFIITFVALMVGSGICQDRTNEEDRRTYEYRITKRIRGSLLALFVLWLVLIILSYALTSLLSAIATAAGCIIPIILIVIAS